MTASETVYAIHNFEAENDDELNFYIGEPIIVLQKDDGFNDGWWKVRTYGRRRLMTHFYILGPKCKR